MTIFDTTWLRASFDAPAPMTVGIEEELMLLDPGSLDLAPVAALVLKRLAGDDRFKGELPAAQIELVSQPAPVVGEAAAQVAQARRDLSAAAAGLALPAAAGAHPFTDPHGALSDDKRYAFTRKEYGPVAARQLVFGLHVHVRVSGADRALAVYNALRSHLPHLAALGANAPFHAGRDTGLASVRPQLSGLLPRQGVPPAWASIEEMTRAWEFGIRAGTFPEPRMWWWELRLHPFLGTVEVRVPDQQTSVAHSAALAAVVHCLIAHLAARVDAGGPLPVHPSWAISENRWSAARHGLEGTLADLDTGEPAPTRERIAALIDTLEPTARRLGCQEELSDARALAAIGGAGRQRQVLRAGDLRTVVRSLAEDFLT